MTPKGIERVLIKVLEGRHPRMACPSDVARAIEPGDWRALMGDVRAAAGWLAKRGRLDVLQKGKKVDVEGARGPIRLRLAAAVEAYRHVDFRREPERYRVGRGEQGVLTVESQPRTGSRTVLDARRPIANEIRYRCRVPHCVRDGDAVRLGPSSGKLPSNRDCRPRGSQRTRGRAAALSS